MLDRTDLAVTCNVDRLLPSQPYQSKFYRGEDFFGHLNELMLAMLPVKSIEQKWAIEEKPGVAYASLGSDLSILHFYQMLIRLAGYQRVLELGTFIGVSTLFLAEAVGPGGHVMSIEVGEEFYDLARRNLHRNGMASRVNLLKGCALQILTQMAKRTPQFDLILIDAAKQIYPELLGLALTCVEPSGLILVDDVFMQGDAVNPLPGTEKGRGVRALLMKLERRDDLDKVILPIGDGLLLVRRRTA